DRIFKEAQRRSPAFADMSLRDFSKFANESTGSTAFAAGDVGPVGRTVKRASAGFDRLLRPVSEPLGEAGRSFGALIGPKTSEVMGNVMESAPRTLGESAAVLSAFAAGSPVTI